MKHQTITYKHDHYIVEFTPLENGKCQYLVDFHDVGNLESLVDRILSYSQLNECLNNPKDYIACNRYNI